MELRLSTSVALLAAYQNRILNAACLPIPPLRRLYVTVLAGIPGCRFFALSFFLPVVSIRLARTSTASILAFLAALSRKRLQFPEKTRGGKILGGVYGVYPKISCALLRNSLALSERL